MAEKKRKAVGYRNPPAEHRFRPGNSGNPAGRPKGRTNTKTAWRKCLNETVEVTIRGQKKTMTVLEAMIRRLLHSSISGDFKALQYALSQAGLYDNDPEDTATDAAEEAQRRQLLDEIIKSLTGRQNERPSP